jgi:hypothetical protein
METGQTFPADKATALLEDEQVKKRIIANESITAE